MGTRIEVQGFQGGRPHVAAVSGISKIVVGASADYIKEHEDVSVDDKTLLKLGVLQLKESISHVRPGVNTSIIEHRVHLVDDCPSRCRSHAVQGEIQEEIQEIINNGIICESNLPYALPMVVVKKKDGSNHICVSYYCHQSRADDNKGRFISETWTVPIFITD